MKNKSTYLWLMLPTFAILAVLLIRQYGSEQGIEPPTPIPAPDKTLAQSNAASSVASSNDSDTCLRLPLEIGNGDFTSVDDALKCILAKYEGAAARGDKQRILALDAELQGLELSLTSFRDDDRWWKYWQNHEQHRYDYLSKLGVSIDETGLQYDGSLRYEDNNLARRKKVAEFELIKPQLDQILAAFRAVPKTSEIPNIEKLYGLDEQLEKLAAEAREHSFGTQYLSPYQDIGVFDSAGTYYNGSIRLVADKLLPPGGFVDPKSGKPIQVAGDRYSRLKNKLEDIYSAYRSLKQKPEDSEAIYEMSEEISRLMDEIHKVYPGDRSQVFWDRKYEVLGMYVGHYSDRLDYSGKLLVDSYRLNPDSKYGEATLAAAMSGAGDMSELSDIPDLKLAETYLKKYPSGKHTSQVYRTLATFYRDLFDELLDGDKKSPILLECFNKHLERYPEDRDVETARKKAISYFKRLMAIDQSAKTQYQEDLSNLERRIDGHVRNWCTD